MKVQIEIRFCRRVIYQEMVYTIYLPGLIQEVVNCMFKTYLVLFFSICSNLQNHSSRSVDASPWHLALQLHSLVMWCGLADLESFNICNTRLLLSFKQQQHNCNNCKSQTNAHYQHAHLLTTQSQLPVASSRLTALPKLTLRDHHDAPHMEAVRLVSAIPTVESQCGSDSVTVIVWHGSGSGSELVSQW